ncbi:hypothetical protein PMAYCL1PPCAC_32676, partial [Pristionchus mayeri]
VSSVFLSSQVEELYFIIIRIIFSISIFLHCVSLILLTKFTPPKQASWRNYMLFIQACFITMDLYMEILFIPLPLFPVPAGYTTGLLCTLKIPVQIQAGIAFLLISFICVSVLLCVLYRHQSILVGVHRFKLRKLVTPMLLFGIPTLLIGTGISVDGFLLFEQSLMCFTAILLHPIAHNILLISMTPSFRTTLLNGLKCKISFLARVGP